MPAKKYLPSNHIEAMEVTRENLDEVLEWTQGTVESENPLVIKTGSGMLLEEGYHAIKTGTTSVWTQKYDENNDPVLAPNGQNDEFGNPSMDPVMEEVEIPVIGITPSDVFNELHTEVADA